MCDNDFAAQLQSAVGRHIVAPGTVHDLKRLNGGANKTTWSFDADAGGKRLELILQLSSVVATDQPNPLEGITPRVTADEDARLMIAAVKGGVPAPIVRAILETSDGMGAG